MSLIPQNIEFTPEEEEALDRMWDEIAAEEAAKDASRAKAKAKRAKKPSADEDESAK